LRDISFNFDFSLFRLPHNLYFVTAAFLLLGITAFRATDQLSKTLLIIEEDEIKRITEKEAEIFLISNIVKIVAKKRSTGGIREITFVFHNGKTLIINAFEENFEEILKIVTSKLNPEFAIKYTHEPIDYDYTAFYSILGLLLGFIFAFCFDYTTKINYQSFEFISYLISIYLFSLGAYFLVKKPLTVNYGHLQKRNDILIGFSMIIFGILIFSIRMFI
jgi:thiamine phosphate synthase YjbQ (UPF0047 family)